jgi:trigger factor
MQVAVEELEGLERRMTVQVPAEEIDSEVQKRLKNLASRVRLDGFRPGKVPYRMVKRLYGPQMRQEVLGQKLEDSFSEALNQVELRPAGEPKIEPKEPEQLNKEGSLFEYSATFEIFPTFEPRGIDGVPVERPVAEVTDDDIDQVIATLRQQHTSWAPVERPSQEGDRVTMDFEGKWNGKDFPNNTGENVDVILGSGTMIKGFEDKLMGLSAGAETEFELTFPDDYSVPELAGEEVRFTAKVNSVAAPKPFESDEELAVVMGVKEGGSEALRKAVGANMERQLNNTIQSRIKEKVMQCLLDANDIPLPRTLIDAQLKKLTEQARLWEKPGEGSDEDRTKTLEPAARRQVALSLIIGKLVEINDIQPDPERVRAQLASLASTYENPEMIIEWYRQNPEALGEINALALEDQLVDWLLERADVTEVPSTFNAIVKGTPATTEGADTHD